MLEKEVKILKEYLGNDNNQLEIELAKLEEQVEIETINFFSQYKDKDIDDAIKEEFRRSLRNIYIEKIEHKKNILNSITTKVSQFEQNYA